MGDIKKPQVRVKKRGKPMTDHELKGILRSARAVSVAYNQEGEISQEREKALKYYRGEKLGNEQRGRSQVISRDALETVESMLPEIMEPFVGSDHALQFEPGNAGDEDKADQATDYVFYVLMRDNPGFMCLHTMFKDALVQKVGVAAVEWEVSEKKKKVHYKGLNSAALNILVSDPNVELEERRAYILDPATGSEIDQPDNAIDEKNAALLWEVKVCHYEERGVNRVHNYPPEEFFISPRSKGLEPAPEWCGTECEVPASDLLEEYPDQADVIDSLPGHTSVSFGTESTRRYDDENFTGSDFTLDAAMRKILRTQWYIFVDYDGDGVAELRKIVTAGEDVDEVLENEEVDDHPFASVCPLPEPHKFHGMSAVDLVMDIQDIKTAIERQLLNGMYQALNQRMMLLNGQVNMDDWLNNIPGGGVRVSSMNAIAPIPHQPVGQEGMQLLEKMDQIREARTGSYRNSRGLEMDRIHDTAQGIHTLLEKMDKRLMLIVRIFAETGVKRLCKLILKNCIQYQDKARMIRLRDKWVEMDPRTWDAEMDMVCHVGLGTGNREQEVAMIVQLLQTQAELAMRVPGMVTPQKVYSALTDLVRAWRKKTPERYFVDPSGEEYQPPEPQPDPKAMEAQAKIQLEQAKNEMQMQKDAQEAQLKLQETQAKLTLDKYEADQKMRIEKAKLALERERMAFEKEVAIARLALDRELGAVRVAQQRMGGSAAS